MSSNGDNLKEADLVPGAFPSEDAIAETERDIHNPHNSALTGTNANSGRSMDEKNKDFREEQKAAHTAGGQKTDSYTPGLEDSGDRLEISQDKTASKASTRANSGPGQTSEAWTDVANPETLLRSGDAEGNTPTGSQSIQTSSTSQKSSTAQSGGSDENSIGSNLATVATAVGLAAKDALFAAKDAAGPAASAATEQAKNLAGYSHENAAPAANYLAEQAGKAATYTKDTVASGASSGNRDTVPTDAAMDTIGSAATYAKDTAYSAANTAQSYAPNVLGEPSTTGSAPRDIAPEVPSTVQESVTRAGESPEAATNAQAVENKSHMERELLGQSQTQERKNPHEGLTSRVKGLEEQLAPESMTPGVVTVLGTEQDRSFPLGATDHPSI